MPSIRTKFTSLKNHGEDKEGDGVQVAPNSQEQHPGVFKPWDNPQAMLGQAIRDGETWLVLSLLGHPGVSLNHREVTHDLQTPLMRLCHAYLQPLPKTASHSKEVPDEVGKAELCGMNPSYRSTASQEQLAAPSSAAATLKILEIVDRLHLAEPAESRSPERIHLDRQDAVGRTLAMHACVSQNVAVLRWVLARGCSLLAADREGRNVLHYAACSGSEAAVDLALGHTDALNALQTLDYQGYSPLDMARQRRYTSAVKKLSAALRANSTTDQGSTPSALPRGENASTQLLRAPLSHPRTLRQSPRSSDDDSGGRLIHAEPVSPRAHRLERASLGITQGLGEIHHQRTHVTGVPSPRKALDVHKERPIREKPISPNRSLDPLQKSPQSKQTMSQVERSLVQFQNCLPSSPYGNKIHSEAPFYNKLGFEQNVISNAVTTKELLSPASVELFKASKARIPTTNDTESLGNELDVKAEWSTQQPLAPCSAPRRRGTSPQRRSPFSSNTGIVVDGSTEVLADKNPVQGLAKLKKYDHAVEALLSPHRSHQPRQRTLISRDNDNTMNAQLGRIASNSKGSQQQNHPKLGLLTKRHQKSSEIWNARTEENDTPDSCDTTYIFEEEIFLDTPRNSGRDGGNGPRAGACDHQHEEKPRACEQRRDSLSLPDLRDMTGQLVTSREVSPIFRTDPAPRQQLNKTWAVKTLRGQGSQFAQEPHPNSEGDDHDNRQGKDVDSQAHNESNKCHPREADNAIHKNKASSGIHQGDPGVGLPTIITGISDRE